jgi:catechol 2,3-dioxygenase-like lactoylglutathione lyase family enzyme
MPLLRLTHIGLCVSDWERSLRFYRDLLGFRYVSEFEVAGEPSATLLQLPDVHLRAIYLERDGTRIELLHYAQPGQVGDGASRPMNQLGLTHLSFRVADLAALLRDLRQAGVQILERTRIDIPAFEAAAVFIADPDGTLIELVEAPGDPTLAPGQVAASSDE